MEKRENKKRVCCLCGDTFEGYGNESWPVKSLPYIKSEDGVCCDDCNTKKVIPTRIVMQYREHLYTQQIENHLKVKKQIKEEKEFKTIISVIKYLDGKYTRNYWMNTWSVEQIKINGIRTTVSEGLRMDPCTDKEYKYYRNLEYKYPELQIRLT